MAGKLSRILTCRRGIKESKSRRCHQMGDWLPVQKLLMMKRWINFNWISLWFVRSRLDMRINIYNRKSDLHWFFIVGYKKRKKNIFYNHIGVSSSTCFFLSHSQWDFDTSYQRTIKPKKRKRKRCKDFAFSSTFFRSLPEPSEREQRHGKGCDLSSTMGYVNTKLNVRFMRCLARAIKIKCRLNHAQVNMWCDHIWWHRVAILTHNFHPQRRICCQYHNRKRKSKEHGF